MSLASPGDTAFNTDRPDINNLGWGKDISIAELADLIKEILGFEGQIVFDAASLDKGSLATDN